MSSPSILRHLLTELKRRGVPEVAAAYGAAAFVAIEVSDLILPRIGLGEDWVTAVVWLALAALPAVIALAWFYDISRHGIERTRPLPFGTADQAEESKEGRRWPVVALGAGGVVLLLVAAWFGLGRPGAGGGSGGAADGTDATTVAVLPFAVSGGTDYAYLRSGMVDLLSTRLDGIGPLRSIPARAVLGIARQQTGEEEAVLHARRAGEIARTLGAGLFVSGRVVESGDRLSVAASLFRTGSTEPVAEVDAEGGADELFGLVDQVTTQLVAGYEDTPASRFSHIAALTTSSLPALEAYLEGEQLFREGRFGGALEAYERATSIDSTFALAHYRLGIAREWAGEPGALEAAENAARHAGRLSEHDRLLVEATLAWRRGDGERAADLYRTILGRWPDDVEAWLELAEVLNHYGPLRGGSISDSREAFETALRYEPRNLPALWHLARIELAEGNTEAADSLVDRIRKLAPEGDRILELQAMRSAGRRPAEWESVVDALYGAQDMTRWMTAWNVAVYAEELEHARAVLGTLTDPSRSTEVRMTGHLLDAFLALARGRVTEFDASMSRVEEFEPYLAASHRAAVSLLPFLDPDPDALRARLREITDWSPEMGCQSSHPNRFFEPGTCVRPFVRLYLLGLLEARLGREDRARQRLGELERVVGESPPDHSGPEFVAGVRAAIALSRGDTIAALGTLEASPGNVEYLDAFDSIFYSHPHERYLRAQLLETLGRPGDALRWYESFDEMSPFDLVFLGPALVGAGRVLEASGRPEEASDRYREAALLLENAEGPYAEFGREAREALERLES